MFLTQVQVDGPRHLGGQVLHGRDPVVIARYVEDMRAWTGIHELVQQGGQGGVDEVDLGPKFGVEIHAAG